jgi:hypothetical protein
VLTTRDAARALSAAGRSAPLGDLGLLLGFRPPLPLDHRELARLGVDDRTARGEIAPGPGVLRALLIEWGAGAPLRDRIAALSHRLATTSPGLNWLVIARRVDDSELAVAVPNPDGRGPVQALVVDTAHVRESDAETFAALAASSDGVDLLVHLRWRETLGRDALTRRFYRDLAKAVATLATTATGRAGKGDRRTIAVLTASRFLFLAFLEAKGWLDQDRAFLRHQVEALAGGAGLHRRLLEPLFFGTLNTPIAQRARAAAAFGRVPFLNGGLFARSALESRHRDLRFTDDALGAVIGDLLARYRLTARETSESFSDAAVDPEMLGRAFESLMADESRRARGAFYTPHPLIARITNGALGAMSTLPDSPGDARAFRVIDPACGSGAFLVFALEALAARRIAAGDVRALSAVRRHVLTQNIFGVDIDPTAVWLCQLRLWLSVVVEDERDDPLRLPPLPNLDRNIRVGDALAGRAFEDPRIGGDPGIEGLRLRYSRASGVRKRTLVRALDSAERRRACASVEQRLSRLVSERRDLLLLARTPDLFQSRRGADAASRRSLDALRPAIRTARTEFRRLQDGGALPFSFATHFPEVAANGGFEVVIGNPPWVRPHAIAAEQREALRARFESFRRAAWESGAAAAGAGRGFASQADLSALFTERALQLARPGGLVALLLPSKLWSALAGGGVRDLVARRASLLSLEDWGGADAGFDAAVYPSAILARKHTDAPASPSTVKVTLHRAASERRWEMERVSMGLDSTPGAPWLLLPPEVRTAFDVMVASGTPLSESPFGRPLLGVKSGCNEAFVVEPDDGESRSILATVRSRTSRGTVRGSVDRSVLRPLVRGEHLRAWHISGDAEREAIVWTHDARGTPERELPPDTRRWLTRWRRRLEARSDGRGAPWWALFRTESARTERPRVIWGDIGLVPRASVLVAGDPTVPLNTCYVALAPTEDDAHALAALLNSAIAAAWLGAVAEPARGGYRRFLGWTCARFPLPRDWRRARALLAPLGRRGMQGQPPDEATLTHTVTRAYRIAPSLLAPLLAWR